MLVSEIRLKPSVLFNQLKDAQRALEPCIRFGSEVESSPCRMPLYIRKQTSVSMIDMSALGDFRMSAVY
jgi:hypothetical protein